MELEVVQDIESIGSGILMPEFLSVFNDAFQKSGVQSLNKFIKSIDCAKWTIYSDYAFKGKVNDVIIFSILPYLYDFSAFKKVMNELVPRDIKNTNSIKKEFLGLLRNMPIMHIAIVLSRKRKINYFDERNFLLHKTKAIISQLEHWCETTPEAKEKYLIKIKHFKSLKNELKKNSPNLNVIRDIEIVATLVSYIITAMSLAKELEIVGWFSDRDTILNYMKGNTVNPIIFDLVDLYTFALSKSQKMTMRSSLVFGMPEEANTMWYDEFNRIPDYIAGAIADYDVSNNAVSNNKFKDIIEESMASNENLLYYKLILDKSEIQASRILIKKNSI